MQLRKEIKHLINQRLNNDELYHDTAKVLQRYYEATRDGNSDWSTYSFSPRAFNVLNKWCQKNGFVKINLATLADMVSEAELRRIGGCGSLTIHDIGEVFKSKKLTLKRK